MTDVRTGRCLCGAVTFEAELGEDAYGACHCSMCRRWTGGAPLFAIQATVRVTAGEDRIASYRSSDWAERAFCAACGMNLWYRVSAPGPHEGAVHLAVGTLEDAGDLSLASEIFIDEKPAGYALAGETRKLTGAEVFAMFAPPSGADETGG